VSYIKNKILKYRKDTHEFHDNDCHGGGRERKRERDIDKWWSKVTFALSIFISLK
jgi:hypothetical protein